MLSYRFFAKSYGWTPEQVDSLPDSAYEWLPKVEQAHARVIEMEQKAAAREARGKQRRGF